MRLFILFFFLFIGCSRRGLVKSPYSGMGGESYPKQSKEAWDNYGIAGGRLRGEKIATCGLNFLGQTKLVVEGEQYRYDCSGFVMAAHMSANVQVEGASNRLYETAQKHQVLHRKTRPFLGDVVFFDNTYDRNKNGKRDDLITHVALVTAVDANGTIEMVHLGGSGIKKLYMNLRSPNVHKNKDGLLLNSYLRVKKDKDNGPRLSGELWKAFGSMWAIPSGDLDI